MSMLSQAFYVLIGHGISAPGHYKEVVDGLNAIDKSFILKLMPAKKLPSAKGYDTQMVMHNGTHTYDVSLVKEFQKHLSNVAQKHEVIDQGK